MLESVLSFLKELNKPYKLGVAGSVARGKETNKSDIDVVVDDTNGISIEQYEDAMEIVNLIKSHFKKNSDILFLLLIKEEDEQLDELLKSEGLPINENSAYKNILREVVWCE
jgi:predicted nucleotidyltransferase